MPTSWWTATSSVEQVAWVLLGARVEKDADGVIFVCATDRTSRFPAIESMRRTIFESSGADVKVKDLDLGRTTVAGLPAESAALPSDDGRVRRLDLHVGQDALHRRSPTSMPHSGAFDLAKRVPGLSPRAAAPTPERRGASGVTATVRARPCTGSWG